MTYIVKDECIKCKLTDCVDVCPVDCFYEGENFLAIDPDECIDCGVCEPECPLDAIKARVMAQSFTHKVSYYNIMKAMKFKDYFTGISVSATRGAIACSAMFYTVDVVRNYLHNNY